MGENEEFWKNKAALFNTSIEQAQTMRCKNCAAFIQKPSMINCIEKGVAQISEEELAKEKIEYYSTYTG